MCAIWTNIVTVCTIVFAKDWMRQNVHCLNQRLVPVPDKPYGFCGRKATCVLIFTKDRNKENVVIVWTKDWSGPNADIVFFLNTVSRQAVPEDLNRQNVVIDWTFSPSLALDPTFRIHFHKTLDTAQPCHLLKPN